MVTENASLEALQDIKKMMDRSSRFISLSGLSGVSAGVAALAGGWIARGWLIESDGSIDTGGSFTDGAQPLIIRLMILAAGVAAAALLCSIYFTRNKARKNQLPVWDLASKKLLLNLAIPLLAGGVFIEGLLYNHNWSFIVPASLVFYGLALVNASKFTLSDIRYMGMLEIVLGSVCIYYPAYGLIFWAAGFGMLHIVYGLIMWWKYDFRSAKPA